MATSKIEKGGMILDENKLTIFGDWGMPNGKTWIVPFTGDVGVEVAPDPASPNIEGVINSDIQSGNADKIACVQVGPHTAILLYLEGKITRKNIEQAVVDEQSVTFADIKFNTENGEMVFPVVVKADSEHSIVTLDKDGNIV